MHIMYYKLEICWNSQHELFVKTYDTVKPQGNYNLPGTHI